MAIKKSNQLNQNISGSSYWALKDAALSMESGTLKSDKRIQVKMPAYIVDELDSEFPSVDRSKVLTMAAIDLLLDRKRNKDPDLEHWRNEEQYDMDRMWDYLEERDARK